MTEIQSYLLYWSCKTLLSKNLHNKVTDKWRNWRILFFFLLSLCLPNTLSLGSLACQLGISSLKLQTPSGLCLVSAQSEEHLGAGVVGVTSVQHSSPKTNINTVKHKCYHLVECIFWLHPACHSAFTLGEELSF